MNDFQNKIFSVENKTILVTGASSGLGKHFSCTLAKSGAFVVLVGRKHDTLNQVAQEIESFGGKCACYEMDVTNFASLQNHIDTICTQFGKIDVLVNNAGLTSKIKKEAMEYSLEEWDAIMNTNVKSMWHLCKLQNHAFILGVNTHAVSDTVLKQLYTQLTGLVPVLCGVKGEDCR